MEEGSRFGPKTKMRFTLASIEGDDLSIARTLESFIKIHPKDLSATINELKQFLQDIQKVKEAVLQKKERKISQLKQLSFSSIKKELLQAESQVSNISSEEDSNVREILRLHNDLSLQKNTKKALELLSDLKLNDERPFEALLNDPSEWAFFCSFLFHVPLSDQDGFLKKFQNKTEKVILQKFEDLQSGSDHKLMRKCYLALKELHKESLIVDSYLLSTGFQDDNNNVSRQAFSDLNNDQNTSHRSGKNFKIGERASYRLVRQDFGTIEIDNFTNYDNTFCQVVDRLERLYEEESVNLNLIFGNDTEVLDKIHQSISNTLERHLETLFGSENPFIFLNDLSTAMEKSQSLCIVIQSTTNNFDEIEFLETLFSNYLSTAIQKEKDTVDLFYDIMVHKKRPDKQYTFRNSGIFEKEFHPYKAFRLLVFLFTKAVDRYFQLKYKKESFSTFKKHFIRKISELVSFINSSNINQTDLQKIKIITDIYVITKKLNIEHGLKDLDAICSEKLNKLFISCVEDFRSFFKKEIAKFDPTEDKNLPRSSMIDSLVLELGKCQKEVSFHMSGKNGQSLMQIIIEFIAQILYKEYLKHKYTVENKHLFYNDITYVIGSLNRMSIYKGLDLFHRMSEISKTLVLEQSSLSEILRELKTNFPFLEIKRVLKCRPDYDRIKDTCKKILSSE